ncbi:MAG: dTDP-4-dehydrorhamnose reductase [Methylophilaceae bacterium]
MNILVLGNQGQVGWELARSLLPLGKVMALGRQGADLASPDALRQAVRASEPDLIVNAAAYTAVDKAETDEAAAMAINAIAPGILAEEARHGKALLIHYSTDYVFDGQSNQAYVETDPTNPQSAYGRSKLAGEKAVAGAGCDHLILRTSWVYGARGHNFMRTVLRLAQEREHLRIVADQTGAPTWSRWIADATAHVARQAMDKRAVQAFQSGTYHLACASATSWHGFASAIIEQHRLLYPAVELAVQAIEPIPTAEYPLPAKRPANSRLDCHKLAADYGIAAPDWQQALRLCMMDM